MFLPGCINIVAKFMQLFFWIKVRPFLKRIIQIIEPPPKKNNNKQTKKQKNNN